MRTRSSSNPPPPSIPMPVAPPPVPSASGEKWAEVMFTFLAEFPDELTIEVIWDLLYLFYPTAGPVAEISAPYVHFLGHHWPRGLGLMADEATDGLRVALTFGNFRPQLQVTLSPTETRPYQNY